MIFRMLKRHWPVGAVLLITLYSLLPALERDLWFDEALTLMNFAMLPSATEIYRQYVIPNNQILHTILLHMYLVLTPETLDFTFFLRLLPCLTALATLALLYGRFRVRFGSRVLLPLMTALAVSLPFQNYGTALRGYMLSALLVLAATDCALTFARCGDRRSWLGWFLCSFAAIGTIPTNLLALAGAVLYALPLCGPDCYRRKRFWIMAATPVTAFALFYLPIVRQLLQASRLGEGWHDGMAALGATYAALIVAFAMLLVPVILGASLLLGRPGYNWTFSARAAILLLPIPACLLLPVAPFPRVFFVLWPLWLLLGAGAIKRLVAWQARHRRRWSANTFLFALTAATCVWGVVEHNSGVKTAFSRRFGGAMGDDYFLPYYMREDFRPRRLMSELVRRIPVMPEAVYLSFSADPWALMFYGSLAGWNGDIWRFDGPRGRIRQLPEGVPVILHTADPPEPVGERFFRRLTPILTEGRNTVYR